MQATAYIVGPVDGPGAALLDLARRLGFATVLPYAGLAQAAHQAHHTPICYFLFAAVPDVGVLRGVAEAIRFCPNRRLRFSPLLYFSESLQLETISRCINMGFDDVITMPCTSQLVAERLERQVGHQLTYYETPSYFGPDRRDRVTTPARAVPGGQFRRLEIIRNVLTGIHVISDESELRSAG